MPVPVRLTLRPALALLCLPALAGLLASVLYRQAATDARQVHLGDWQVTDLLDHLRSRGLTFRAIPTWKGGIIAVNAFLVRGEKPWTDLEGLVKSPKWLPRWKDVVYCERLGPEAAESRVGCWKDACLRADPFIFFGDPDMLAQIRSALGDSCSSPD